jgi:hypothetical protein
MTRQYTSSGNTYNPGILRQSGTYAIVLGGPENPSSQAAIALIDKVAKAKGVPVVYHFDPKLDGGDLDILDTSIATNTQDAAFPKLWDNGGSASAPGL